ncbi:antitoxin VapB family protein [Natrarchaeobaculum aegyptiacum]|uniref:Antitoxin n=1 Tax=Natrarchaeobaculum aegyptiacum TaxID=745377 RepID=A0A2Z2HXL5_9EURY|nr:antitoxin VapB family protein [Natrarchaeobaculum aegyptiacum]ARS90417.1 hypothetical protein B1756_12210 [Natrarchaeobaculum aegyptiacum]
MATTTISLTEEAYESLKALKEDDESFSDVVQRLTGAERDKMKGFGSWADSGLREEVASYRDGFETDAAERIDELS